MSNIERHQTALRFLVILQGATFILAIASVLAFPEPEEITSALAVMDELDESSWNGVQAFLAIILGLGELVLWAWSLWQLYHLNEKGFLTFLASVGLYLVSSLVFGGMWETGVLSFIDEIRAISSGAIIYIGFFFSNTLEMLTGSPPAADEELAAGKATVQQQ